MTGRPRWMSEPARDFALFGLPALLILAWLAWPLIAGGETLILRDVLKVHLMLKAPYVEAIGGGSFPLIDPQRMGGQPLAGNPNAVPFYPDNLLFLVAPLFWAFNAHFWLHLLLAPLATYWMCRAWGLSRPASWAAAVCYGASGYMLSQLNLYNLVAGAALIPALVAAVLSTVRARGRPRWIAAASVGFLWALLVLSGDPLMAALGLVLAGSAAVVRHGRGLSSPRATVLLVSALALGTLAALPQIVEFARILPVSARGHEGFGAWRLSVGAFRPLHAVEWLVPLAFGRYDLIGEGGHWGASLFEGKLPIFLSLYPGLLALVLVAASGRPRTRPAWWAWGAVGVGVFFALGASNPAAVWLLELPGGGLFRYPVKVWPLVAVGASLLCGVGFERVVGAAAAGTGRVRLRPAAIALAALGLALVGVWLVLILAPGRFEAIVLEHAPRSWPASFAAAERGRWIATVVASFAIVGGLGAALALCRTRPSLGACLLLALHAVGQVFFLRPLAVTDEVAFYRTPPPALAGVAPGAPVTQADSLDLFGTSPEAVGPDNRPQWVIRQDHLALDPFSGILHGLRYELARSPEGLGTFLAEVAASMIRAAPDDATRLRALSRWGVATVVSQDPLAGVPPNVGELVGTFPGILKPIHVYRLPRAAPELLFAERILPVPHLNAARDLFLAPGFDPDREVILPGGGTPPDRVPATDAGARGRVRAVARGPERIVADVESEVPGVLVVQRAHLSIWRATVDGEPADIEPANLYRMGVRVPAGEHRVRLWVDRRPLVASSIAALVGLLGLAGLALAGWRRRGAGKVAATGADHGGTRGAPADSIRTP